MNEKLKPCPCGCEAKLIYVRGESYGLHLGEKYTSIKCSCCSFSANDVDDWNARADGWISVEVSLPELQFESQEDPDEDGYPQFDGMVSQTIEITDGEGFGRGHLRSDGKWICYGAEYDMMIVDPEKVTHWAQLRKLPKAVSCGE